MLSIMAVSCALSMPQAGRRVTTAQLQRRLPRCALTMKDAGPVEVNDDWLTTSSGLQYLDVVTGSGQDLKQGDV